VKPEEQRQRQRLLGRVILDVFDASPEEPFPGELPAEVEDLLWDYALGLLEPSEERRIIKLLARSEQAEKILVRIRGSIEEAGMANPIEVPAAARLAMVLEIAQENARQALDAVGLSLSSIAGVVVKLADGLVSALEEHRVPAWQPVMGGEERKGPTRVGSLTIPLKPKDGLSGSVIRMPDGQVDIEVRTEPAAEGRVNLFELIQTEAASVWQPTNISDRLRKGRARLKGCREGILKIVSPDGREIVLVCTRGEA